MKKVSFCTTPALALEEVNAKQVMLNEQDYLARIAVFRQAMAARKLDICVVYGDREHFSNMEYLSGYDCRFEEGLLIIPAEGTPTIVVGNEGMAYSDVVPYPVNRVYYRNFSLQGQPRRKEESLEEILRTAGVRAESRLGVIGFKFFLPEFVPSDPAATYDLPSYVMEAIFRVCPPEQVCNATELMTNNEDGIRLNFRSAKEIAMMEAAASRAAAVLLRMLKTLKPGIKEYEVGEAARMGFAPWAMFPLTNFGEKHVYQGLRSPDDVTELEEGMPCGVCYAIRYSLASRVGVAAHDEASMGAYQPYLMPFYGKFFEAMCNWYRTVRIGVTGHELYHAVHSIIGGSEYNVDLNPGHYVGGDEWVNSPSADGSAFTLKDGACLQADIIASNTNPVRSAICEDTIVLAGPELRQELKEAYPEVYDRIMKRREMMQNLGMELADEVLPMSNLNAVMFPFMLNLNTVFCLREEQEA